MDRELFSDSLVEGPGRPRPKGTGLPVSLTAHLLIGSAIVLIPILWPSELPPVEGGIRVALYDLAPPPPPPIALGSERAKPKPEQKVTPEETKKVEPKE